LRGLEGPVTITLADGGGGEPAPPHPDRKAAKEARANISDKKESLPCLSSRKGVML